MSHKKDHRFIGTIKCSACHKWVPKGTLVQHMSAEHPIKPKPKIDDAPHLGYRDAKP